MATGTVDPRTIPTYSSTERHFYSIFGAQEDFGKYLSDPNYRRYIESLGKPGWNSTSPELQTLLSAASFKPIDVASIYEPLKGEIGEMAEASRMAQRQQIGAAARGAEEQATEALAGTGLGRSGVAAQQFGDIQQRKQDILARTEGEIEQQRLRAMFEVSLKQANTEYAEQLRAAGFSEQMVRDALNFDRMLYQMQFGAELQAELQEQGGGWFEDLVNIGSAAATIIAAV